MGSARHSRTAQRRKPSAEPIRKPPAAQKRRSVKVEEEIVDLVRTGVERFLLENATFEDFVKTIRAVAEKEKVYSHPLTRSVFSSIVKEAIRKRNLGRSR